MAYYGNRSSIRNFAPQIVPLTDDSYHESDGRDSGSLCGDTAVITAPVTDSFGGQTPVHGKDPP